MPNLFIDVEARFAKFHDSLDRIKRDADGFVGSLTRSFGRVQSLFVGVGVSLGALGFAERLRETINAADQLQNVSEKTGLTVEALSELKFAADQTDVTFEELQDGLKKLAVAIDSNNDAFRRLDLDPAQFKSTDEALAAIADRFVSMRDPIAEAALAVELFGRNGTTLIPFLKQGAAGIQQFRDEAKRLGVVFSSDFAKSSEEFNDNLKRLQASFQAFNITVGQTIIGPLADFIERLLEIKQLTGTFFGDFEIDSPADLFRSTTESIKATEDALVSARKELAQLKRDLADTRVVGTPRLAVEAQVSNIQEQITSDEKRLKLLRSDREREIRRDPKLRDLAQRGSDPRNLDARDLGAQNRTFTPGAAKEEKPRSARASSGRSDFEFLQRSLLSQLNQERQLTEEIKLVEDERFNSLSKNKKQSLVTLAQRIDLITEEKRASEISEQSESAARSIQENSVRNELDIIERRKVALSKEFEDRKISVDDYYTNLAFQERRAFEIQIQHLEQLRQEQQKIASDAGSNAQGAPNQSIQARLRATAEVARIEQDITQITRDREDVIIRTAGAIERANAESIRQQVAIAQQVNDALGKSSPTLDRLALEDQFRDSPLDFKQSVTFQAFLDTTIAEKQFSQFQDRVDQIDSRRQVREQSAQISRDSGTITQSEFQTSVVEIRKQSVQLIEEEIEKLSELAKANDIVFGEEQITRLEVLRNELSELKQSTDIYLNSFKDASESEVADFFEAIISGSESADDALKKLGNSIKTNINRKVAQEFTDSLFAGIQKATASEGGLTGFVESLGAGVKSFFGGGQQTPKQQGISFDGGGAGFTGSGGLGLNLESASGGVGAQGGGLNLGSSAGEVSTEGIEAFNAAANEGSSALTGFSQGTITGGESASLFSSTLDQSAPNVGQSMTDLAVSTTTAETGNQSLATASGTATIAVNAFAEAALAASVKLAASGAGGLAAADGAIFSGGYHVAFADGGIISSPTTFPLAGGQTGLMGEAGAEAIMPLRASGGGYAVQALRADGGVEFLSLSRDGAGKLSVVLPSQPSVDMAEPRVEPSGAVRVDLATTYAAPFVTPAQDARSASNSIEIDRHLSETDSRLVLSDRRESGKEISGPLTRNAAGKLSIQMPDAGASSAATQIQTSSAASFFSADANSFAGDSYGASLTTIFMHDGVEAIPARASGGKNQVLVLRGAGGPNGREGAANLPAELNSTGQWFRQDANSIPDFMELHAPVSVLHGGDIQTASTSSEIITKIDATQSYAPFYAGDVQTMPAILGAALAPSLAPLTGSAATSIILTTEDRESIAAGGLATRSYTGGATVAAFANGGVLEDGRIEAFASGGIVSRPTFFPMKNGQRGLMGEAGPEAIMPLTKKGGAFGVYAIDDEGKSSALALTRDASGRLAVQIGGQAGTSAASDAAFALGGVFDHSRVVAPLQFASGGIFAQGVGSYGAGSRPDAFQPLPDGRSIPAVIEEGGGQGGNIYITQNIATPDVAGFARTRNQMANELRSALGSASRRA